MTIPGGYILQPRCIDDSDIMNEPPVVRELWIYLLRRVNYKDGKFPRGTNFFQLATIQDALCWYQGFRKRYYSKPQLSKSLWRLYERNMIATQKATRGVIVTILNYDYYQDPNNYESNDERNMTETRRKQCGNATKQEGEEGRRKKTEYHDDFERFWKFYPRKVGKADAFKAWQRKNGNRPEINDHEQILEQQKNSEQWQKDGGQYIPHPQTWLNQERWQDELTPSHPKKKQNIVY